MADEIAPALEMQLHLLGNGIDMWIAELEIPTTGWRDVITLAGYTDCDEAFRAAKLTATYLWRHGVGDFETRLTVTRMESIVEFVTSEAEEA
jgi:hypothetical protein